MGDRNAAINFYNQAVSSVFNKANGNVQDLTTAYQLFSSAVITGSDLLLGRLQRRQHKR